MATVSRLKQRLHSCDRAILDGIKVFLFDCDGVIWKGSQTIPGAVETLNYLKTQGKLVYFITNNSTKSRADTTKKLQSFGIQSTADQVLTSSYATAHYLSSRGFVEDAYVIGEKGIYDELQRVGIRCIGMEDNDQKDISVLCEMDKNVGTVVVGLDRNINYVKMSRAASYIRDHQCRFIATNADGSYPNAGGIISGGSGCMVAAVSTICGRQPDVVVGKPNSVFIDLILETHPELQKQEIMMVGDRLDTDIAFARKNQIYSLCVLTGIASEESVKAAEEAMAPHFYSNSIADLHALLLGKH